jgi:hypothetical protein
MSLGNPQFLSKALRACEIPGGFKPHTRGVGPSAARAFRFMDRLDCRPAVGAEIKIFFRKNPDAAFVAKCRQKEILETQQYIFGKEPATRLVLLDSRLCHREISSPPRPRQNSCGRKAALGRLHSITAMRLLPRESLRGTRRVEMCLLKECVGEVRAS